MATSFGDKQIQANSSLGYSGMEEHSGPIHSFLEHITLLIFPVVFVFNLHWAGSSSTSSDDWLVARPFHSNRRGGFVGSFLGADITV